MSRGNLMKETTIQTVKFDRNQRFLLRYWMQTFEQIIDWQNCSFIDTLLFDLKMLQFFKVIAPEGTIFTVEVTKGLMITNRIYYQNITYRINFTEHKKKKKKKKTLHGTLQTWFSFKSPSEMLHSLVWFRWIPAKYFRKAYWEWCSMVPATALYRTAFRYIYRHENCNVNSKMCNPIIDGYFQWEDRMQTRCTEKNLGHHEIWLG